MTAVVQEHTARRPASGIVIDPEQLTNMRDLVPLSRDGLAKRTGERLFDREAFGRILSGAVPADARTVRMLWLALDCPPRDLVHDLPAGLSRPDVPRWLRANAGWQLDLAAVRQLCTARGWTEDDLAAAVSRYRFSRDSVNKHERGERRPKAETLEAYCQILGCKPADLMPGSRRLPEGATAARAAALEFNKGMYAYADARGISYRTDAGRIKPPPGLREKYTEYLMSQDRAALAS